MSDKKPFVIYVNAEGYPSEYNWDIVVGGVRVGTRFADPDGNIGHAVETAAEAIRAAVEQREAKLRGALLAEAMALVAQHEVRWRVAERDAILDSDRWQHRQQANVARDIGEALAKLPALGPGPDYVPAEQLHAEQAKTKALQAVVDLLDVREPMSAKMLAEWLEANGLKKPVKGSTK